MTAPMPAPYTGATLKGMHLLQIIRGALAVAGAGTSGMTYAAYQTGDWEVMNWGIWVVGGCAASILILWSLFYRYERRLEICEDTDYALRRWPPSR